MGVGGTWLSVGILEGGTLSEELSRTLMVMLEYVKMHE